MSTATLYFDVISPFAYFADVLLRREPLPIALDRRPILFAGLLNAHGHKGPAEIARKRQFTYEYCTWWAERLRLPFVLPAVHPFNPLKFLRLIVALEHRPEVISAVFDALFTTGADPADPALWRALCDRLHCDDGDARIERTEVKAVLRANTDRALAEGVFGVPTFIIDAHLFWGADALPMIRDYLAEPAFFNRPAMQRAGNLPIGRARPQADGSRA